MISIRRYQHKQALLNVHTGLTRQLTGQGYSLRAATRLALFQITSGRRRDRVLAEYKAIRGIS